MRSRLSRTKVHAMGANPARSFPPASGFLSLTIAALLTSIPLAAKVNGDAVATPREIECKAGSATLA